MKSKNESSEIMKEDGEYSFLPELYVPCDKKSLVIPFGQQLSNDSRSSVYRATYQGEPRILRTYVSSYSSFKRDAYITWHYQSVNPFILKLKNVSDGEPRSWFGIDTPYFMLLEDLPGGAITLFELFQKEKEP